MRSKCMACGLTFNGTVAFDSHRTGSYGEKIAVGARLNKYTDGTRRCMTRDEMMSIDIVIRDDGRFGFRVDEEATKAYFSALRAKSKA